MAEPALPGPYGNLGNASYDEELHEWSFARVRERHYALKLVSNDQEDDIDDGEDGTKRPFGVDHDVKKEKQKVISKWVSQGINGTSLSSLLQLSEAIESTTSSVGSRLGSQISIAHLYDSSKKQTVQVIAWTSGCNGSDISVSRMIVQKQGWHDTRRAYLKVPVPDNHPTVWTGPGTRTQQVYIPEATEDNSKARYLAIRLENRVVILQLDLRGPAICLDPVHEISGSPAGYAHVAFNPWYVRQYITIDCDGNVELWQIERGVPNRVSSGMAAGISTYRDDEQSAITTIKDAWWKVCWISGPTLFAVCSRQQLAVYRIAPEITHLQSIDIPQQGPKCWILDLLVFTGLSRLLFVLTEAHILIFEVLEDAQGVNVSRLLMQYHYMARKDLSLRLLGFADKSGVTLLVSSATSGISMCFRIENLESDSTIVLDPSICRIHDRAKGRRYEDLVVIPVEAATMTGKEIAGTMIERHQRHCLSTHQVIGLDDSFRLQQSLICAVEDKHDYDIPRPDWKQQKSYRAANIISKDLVDDYEETSFLERPTSFFAKALQHSQERSFPQRNADLSKIVTAIDALAHPRSASIIYPVLRRMSEQIRAGKVDHLVTLSEMFQIKFRVDDVDQTDTQLAELIKTVQDLEHGGDEDLRSQLVVRRLPAMQGLATVFPESLVSIYESIISDWISPLSSSIGGRTRLAKEGLARQIATEVFLASHIVRVGSIYEDDRQLDEDQADQEQALAEFTLPVRGPMTRSNSQRDALVSASALPTPSATPSIVTGTSQSSTYAPQKWCLQKITTLTTPLPISLPKSSQRILQHWDIGANPEEYDWRAYATRITRQTEAEELDSQLTERERARLRRKAERHLKRERREAQASQQQRARDSQAPSLLWATGSQPVGNAFSQTESAAGVQSSQTEAIAASQSVPGRFGSRSSRPAKKKRKQGF